MLYEKSCGALVYRQAPSEMELLLIKHRCGGHWSFPKGHVEADETEVQTALREVHEETGLAIVLHDRFRQSVEYYTKPHVKKQVIYFLGTPSGADAVRPQEEEISEFCWCPFSRAMHMVTFKNDKKLIDEAIRFLQVYPGLPASSAQRK